MSHYPAHETVGASGHERTSGFDARTLDPATQEQLRFQAVRLREQGRPLTEVAAICGASPTTISEWHSRYRRGGLDALRQRKRGRQPGTKRELSAAQEEKLQRWIFHETPEHMGFPFKLWSRRVVGALIEQEFGVRPSLTTVGRYLARWGFRARRPLKRAAEQDPVAIREWLHATYPRIRERAKAEGAAIYWGDDTGMRNDSALGWEFAPVRTTPVAALTARHIRVHVVSAASSRGTARFMTHDGSMNADVMIQFMQRLISDEAQKVFLIVKELPFPHAHKVRAWVARHQDAIELFHLPPCVTD